MLITKGTPDDFVNYLIGFWNRQTNTIVSIIATHILNYYFLGKPG